MRAFGRTKAGRVSIALFFGLASAVSGQVNGNTTITAPVFGSPLTISTSSQFGGAISSLKWGGKEFINDWDHGRQLQVNAQFFNRFECYNPYEAGTKEDQNLSKTSSKLLSISAVGNRLESETQMSWYLSTRETRPGFGDYCGDPQFWLPVPSPYTVPLSDYRVHKTVSIGFAGLPNVIEFLSELYVPEPVLKGLNQIVAVTPYEFTSVWSYDVVSKEYRRMRGLSGEDDLIKVVATLDGNYALGFYSPELLQPYGNGVGATNFWNVVPPTLAFPDPNNPSQPDPDFACVHVGSFNHYDSFNGPGFMHDRAYLPIGNLSQVKDALGSIHLQFSTLDPDVYNRREYLILNGLQFALPTEEATMNHWQSQGIAQGLRASRTFSASQYLQLNSDLASAFGPTNYQAAIGHYISAGRAEGRGTVARPAAGMQHAAVLTNGSTVAAGQNSSAQLGNGNTSQVSGVTAVAFDSKGFTEIVAGDYTSLAVKNDGSVWAWGSNQYGARGDGDTGGLILTPVQVPIPAHITTPARLGKHAIAVGTGFCAAIDSQGQVWTWGANWNGRLGDGTTVDHYAPARVKRSATPGDYLTDIISIASGGGTIAVLDADGNVWTWGAGANGSLGNGATSDSGYPVQVVQANGNNAAVPLTGISQVACGSSGFCIALARYGQVFGWGSNNFSQLGIAPGGASSIATPIPVGLGGIDVIAAGAAHCIARSATDGKVYGWGYNGYGQLGMGFASVIQYPAAAMASGPDGMNEISDLAACGNFSVMVRFTDRAVFVAGDNQSGQLSISGNPPAQYLPVRSSISP
jgi:alpha-tubulin suppressor-like RCC1 family protein